LAFIWNLPLAQAGDWRNHQVSLSSQQARINSLESEIRTLIEAKQKANGADQAQAITKQIADLHRELTKVTREFQEELYHVRFRHPERGAEVDRQYPRNKLRTLQDLEKDTSLDAHLDRVYETIARVYAIEGSERRNHRDPASKQSVPSAVQKEQKSGTEIEATDASDPNQADRRIRLAN